MPDKKKEDRTEPICEWFIEPMNVAANTAMVGEFPGQEMEWVQDTKGRQHRVFPCTWVVVDKLLRAVTQASPRPEYKVYSRQGGSKTKRVSFFEPKPPRKLERRVAVAEPPREDDPDDVF